MAQEQTKTEQIKGLIMDWVGCLSKYPMSTKTRNWQVDYLPFDYIAYSETGDMLNGLLELLKLGYEIKDISQAVYELYVAEQLVVSAGKDIDLSVVDNIEQALRDVHRRLRGDILTTSGDYRLRLSAIGVGIKSKGGKPSYLDKIKSAAAEQEQEV